jgi:hypothetical protein
VLRPRCRAAVVAASLLLALCGCTSEAVVAPTTPSVPGPTVPALETIPAPTTLVQLIIRLRLISDQLGAGEPGATEAADERARACIALAAVAKAAPPAGAAPSGVRELRQASAECTRQPEEVAVRLRRLAADGLVYNGTEEPIG